MIFRRLAPVSAAAVGVLFVSSAIFAPIFASASFTAPNYGRLAVENIVPSQLPYTPETIVPSQILLTQEDIETSYQQEYTHFLNTPEDGFVNFVDPDPGYVNDPEGETYDDGDPNYVYDPEGEEYSDDFGVADEPGEGTAGTAGQPGQRAVIPAGGNMASQGASVIAQCLFGAVAVGTGVGSISFAGLSVPTFDGANLIQNTMNSVFSGNSMAKECIQDALANLISKNLLRKMTGDIAGWITSGFNGGPAFVQNLGMYMNDISKTEMEKYLGPGGEMSGACEPLKPYLYNAFAPPRTQSVDGFGSSANRNSPVSCTLSGNINNPGTYQRFVSGDFSSGGWDAWLQITQNPSNNPYGALLAAQDEISARIAEKQNIAQQELAWGNGMQSKKDTQGNITVPGKTISDMLTKSLQTSQDELLQADELNEVLGLLVGQLTSKIMSPAGLVGSLFGGGSGGSSGSSDTGWAVNMNVSPDLAPDLASLRQNESNLRTSTMQAWSEAASLAQQTSSGGSNRWSVSQSSTFSQGGGNAEKAVDGNADGRIHAGDDWKITDTVSVSATANPYVAASDPGRRATSAFTQPWWQLSFTQPESIQAIRIYSANRVIKWGGHGDEVRNLDQKLAVGNFKVFMSNTPFKKDFDPNAATLPAGVWASPAYSMPDSGHIDVPIKRKAKYLRIQRTETSPTVLLLAEVKVSANQKPALSLKGQSLVTLKLNETYKDPGVTAKDDYDNATKLAAEALANKKVYYSATGNESEAKLATFDTSKKGKYYFKYSVMDSSQAESDTVTRTIEIKDEAPRVYLNGSAEYELTTGVIFTDPGVRAYDDEDGDITSKVTVSGSVNSYSIGAYTLQYSVTDSGGQTATATRLVRVVQ